MKTMNPLICLIVLLGGLASLAFANSTSTSNPPMGEETIGNKPLNGLNYKTWPNIMPVANHQSRAYHTWVNGDEMFYFQSTNDQLNELLDRFSKLQSKKKEVVILPQADDVRSFDQSQSFKFNCQMHLVGGIAKHMGGQNKGDIFWPLDPQLTIHVTPDVDLAQLKIPAGVTLVSLGELKTRYKDGLTSTDQNVAGWGIGFLARLDPFDRESLRTIATTSEGDNDWIAQNALANIASFGPKAKDQLPVLERIAKSPGEAKAAAAEKAIKSVRTASEEKNATTFAEKETRFRNQAQRAEEFINRQRGR